LGPEAYAFVDLLAEANQTYWQILPLNPTELVFDNSPYHSISAFACNPLLLSPERMRDDGFLTEKDIDPPPDLPTDRVDYARTFHYKMQLFERAYQRFSSRNFSSEYKYFCRENAYWLEDFALFLTLKTHFGGDSWNRWPVEFRDRNEATMESARGQFSERIDWHKFLQFLCLRQWKALKTYCTDHGTQIIGDLPIYVDYDSADVWSHPELFKLDDQKRAYVVAGVPPDYFSATGQRWGNPIYRWETLAQTGYNWWIQRFRHNFQLFDFVRIDHFRGFVAYWEVPGSEKTAVNGAWVEAPAVPFFKELQRRFPVLPVIAEDLGVITPDVREVIHHFGFPGMKILLFAFGDDVATNPYVPHNLVRNSIVYTGTHDNNTVRGWFEHDTTPPEKARLFEYLGRRIALEQLHWELIRLAMMSVADVAIIPMQDVLGLGNEGRMNLPASAEGNWRWRLVPGQIPPAATERLRRMTELYGRA
jgi:4-alpha-glucanotransferase